MAHKRSSDEDRARDVLAAEELGVPAIAPALHTAPPHDVLAAEEYGVPAIAPALHTEPPHDVLAAEEYGVPDRDPAIHHGPVDLPGDPTGIAEPHDVLAAEEFAMPGGRVGLRDAADGGWSARGVLVLGGAVALAAALLAWKRST